MNDDNYPIDASQRTEIVIPEAESEARRRYAREPLVKHIVDIATRRSEYDRDQLLCGLSDSPAQGIAVHNSLLGILPDETHPMADGTDDVPLLTIYPERDAVNNDAPGAER